MNEEIKNKKVCVIGGAGFLGSHLVDHLIEDRGCDVLVLDNLVSGHRKFVNPKAKFIHLDITASEEYMGKLFKTEGIEYLFNYAAQPYIPLSFERPMYVFNANAVANMRAIHAAWEAGVKKILQVSSAEIYGDAKGRISEDEPVIPHSSYGVSKVAVDNFVQVRWMEAKVPAISMRQFNCYGPRETHPYVIPEIIKQISEATSMCWVENCSKPRAQKTEIYCWDHWSLSHKGTTANAQLPLKKFQVYLGNNSERDFQYAGDAVRMAVELLEKGECGQVYNMGSGNTIRIYELAKLIGKVMGFEGVEVVEDESRKRPWEIWRLECNNDKLYKIISYRPETPFEEGLKKTVQYFLENGGWDF